MTGDLRKLASGLNGPLPPAEVSQARAWAPYVLTALAIWLGWQIVVSVIVQRGPVEAAIRVAPQSAQVLSRAAEAEYGAGRLGQAADLARLSLAAAPFDVRALRVLGLSTAPRDQAAADEMLTLAGNWSLRDDPSHAWLFERRLRQGDYIGAFGHTDVLIRRRVDLREGVFRFFTTAANEDARAVPALLQRMAARPNWRREYLEWLRTAEGGASVQSILALGLESTPGRLTDAELETIYGDWARVGRLPGLLELRRRLARPPAGGVHDGGFLDAPAPKPFRWALGAGAGLAVEISQTEDAPNSALYVESDGFSTNQVAVQLLQIPAGSHRMTGRVKFVEGGRQSHLEWVISCVESGQTLARWRPVGEADTGPWIAEATSFTVPATACTAQWITLLARQGTRRDAVITWFDDLDIAPGADSQ